MCVFNKLHITAQSGPVTLVIPCNSHWSSVCVCVCVPGCLPQRTPGGRLDTHKKLCQARLALPLAVASFLFLNRPLTRGACDDSLCHPYLRKTRSQWLSKSETIIDTERSLLFCAPPNAGSLQFRMLAKRMKVRLGRTRIRREGPGKEILADSRHKQNKYTHIWHICTNDLALKSKTQLQQRPKPDLKTRMISYV